MNLGKKLHSTLSRRERQIMDILYRRGRASVGEVMEALSGEPTYSTVRAQLRVMEEKGHIRHEERGLRYVYLPKVPRQAMGQSALRHLIDTFFEGSTGKVMAALIGDERTKFSDEELNRLEKLIERARKEGRP
jgi:BlaI family penicillinase repressor